MEAPQRFVSCVPLRWFVWCQGGATRSVPDSRVCLLHMARLRGCTLSVSWEVQPPLPPLPPPELSVGPAVPVYEPATNAQLAVIRRPPSEPAVVVTCSLTPPLVSFDEPCLQAHTEAGVRVPELSQGDYVLHVRHWYVDPRTGNKTADPAGFSQLDVPFTVARDRASLVLSDAPVLRTRYRTAKFAVAARLASGAPCGAQCVGFMCKASFQASWQPCGAAGAPGTAVAEYVDVPVGESTFQVTANDTGSWPLHRGNEATWRSLHASYVVLQRTRQGRRGAAGHRLCTTCPCCANRSTPAYGMAGTRGRSTRIWLRF